jgi:hypothetical protein
MRIGAPPFTTAMGKSRSIESEEYQRIKWGAIVFAVTALAAGT